MPEPSRISAGARTGKYSEADLKLALAVLVLAAESVEELVELPMDELGVERGVQRRRGGIKAHALLTAVAAESSESGAF